MKAYNLKSAVRRGSMLTAAFVIAGASLLPAATSYADALNPLTDRSLTLSSSAPGWDFTDGSGNDTYAAPNSGANGKQTGNTFAFKVSTDSSATGTDTALRAITFQYCTAPAGTCTSPGNNGTTSGTRNADNVAAKTSDLNIVSTGTETPVNNAGDAFFDSANGVVTAIPNENGTEGNYLVMWKDQGAGTWQPSTGWTMTVDNDEDEQTVTGTHAAQPGIAPTGKNNFITLTRGDDVLKPKAGAEFKIVFFGTEANYITNPGQGAFFVKINTYKSGYNNDQDTAGDEENAGNLVDGGVTVANVMNLGISIQTKVLETMDFSVGTVDPYTLSEEQLDDATNGGRTEHGTCDPILTSMLPGDSANTLLLGSAANENSLSTDRTYSTHSYFRLSSNASAGATVYYSGVTLSNTVGDQIKPIGTTASVANRGTEQFGLALANNSGNNTADVEWKVNYKTERAAGHLYENGADNAAVGLVALNEWDRSGSNVAPVGEDGTDPSWVVGSGQKLPQLEVYDDGTERVALAPYAAYDQGAGIVNPIAGVYDATKDPALTQNAEFAFDESSNLIPVPIAQEGSKVVDCASAKVRYIANIAATTPAGIYTTKINYIAAPQY